MTEVEERIERLKSRQRRHAGMTLPTTILLLAWAVYLSFLRPPPAPDYDAINIILYQVYADRHPAPNGLVGSPEADAYDRAYMKWHDRVWSRFQWLRGR